MKAIHPACERFCMELFEELLPHSIQNNFMLFTNNYAVFAEIPKTKTNICFGESYKFICIYFPCKYKNTPYIATIPFLKSKITLN